MSKDYLEQLITDYNDGIITIADISNQITYLDKLQNHSKIIPYEYMDEPQNPLEIVLEKERQVEIQKLMYKLKNFMPEDDWNIVVYIAKGKTQEWIAKKLHISQQAVSQRLLHIRHDYQELQELLHSIRAPKTFIAKSWGAYPMDLAMKGNRSCKIPEYLDGECVCCYCSNCTCKSRNKVRRA